MVTRLVWLPPELSSLPTAVSADTDEPVYTPSSVSKLLPIVSMVVWLPPPSSSPPTVVSADTDEPVYTPRIVSKLLPMVSMIAWPVAGAVQLYQTECPPALPAWLGSPVSLVAPTLVPVAEGELPV